MQMSGAALPCKRPPLGSVVGVACGASLLMRCRERKTAWKTAGAAPCQGMPRGPLPSAGLPSEETLPAGTASQLLVGACGLHHWPDFGEWLGWAGTSPTLSFGPFRPPLCCLLGFSSALLEGNPAEGDLPEPKHDLRGCGGRLRSRWGWETRKGQRSPILSSSPVQPRGWGRSAPPSQRPL